MSEGQRRREMKRRGGGDACAKASGLFTAGELVRSVGTVGVGVALLLLGNTLVVAAAELVGRADGWRRRPQASTMELGQRQTHNGPTTLPVCRPKRGAACDHQGAARLVFARRLSWHQAGGLCLFEGKGSEATPTLTVALIGLIGAVGLAVAAPVGVDAAASVALELQGRADGTVFLVAAVGAFGEAVAAPRHGDAVDLPRGAGELLGGAGGRF